MNLSSWGAHQLKKAEQSAVQDLFAVEAEREALELEKLALDLEEAALTLEEESLVIVSVSPPPSPKSVIS